jgi:hypothetical protein
MKTARQIVVEPLMLVLLAGATAPAAELDDFSWREECQDAFRWAAQPRWLGNASPTAKVAGDGETLCFHVDEPGKGMKWSISIPTVAIDPSPYLVVRYRAENLSTQGDDYLVYVDDRTRGGQLNAIRLADAKSDGRWHVAAVDLSVLTDGEAVHGLAVQVQADAKGRARLWLDWLAVMETPPEGAEVIRRAPPVPPQADWAAPLAGASWTAQPGWLSNPAAKGSHRVEKQGEATAFCVDVPARGMKWSWNLPEPALLEGHRYVSLRYRAAGWRPQSDYAVCALGRPAGKDDPGYAAMVPAEELVGDGRWHMLNLDIRKLAARYPKIDQLAIQLQATSASGKLEIKDLSLVNARRPSKLSEEVDWRPGGDFRGFRTFGLEPAGLTNSAPWRRHLHLDDWLTDTAITVEGIPFRRTDAAADLATTGVRGESELRIPAEGSAAEVYLLMLAALVGPEEPAFGSGKLRAIRDVDRFRLRIEYRDGAADECLPMNVVTRQFGISQGAQVAVAAADPSKQLRAVVIRDLAKQAAFAVAAVTARTDGRGFPEALESSLPLRVKPTTAAVRLEADIRPTGPPTLQGLLHRPTGWSYLEQPCPLVMLRVDGRAIPIDEFQREAAAEGQPPDGPVWFKIRSVDGLRLGLVIRQASPAEDSLSVAAEVLNGGQAERKVSLEAPRVGPFRLGENADDGFYLAPRCGATFDNRPCSHRERYCGLFPLQFLDTFNPAEGRGLSLRTTDTACIRKNYVLEKKDGRFSFGVEYPDRTLRPGEKLATATAVIAATDGDWHRGFEAYRAWVRTWRQPRSPRKPWFREIFNFRQRFLWGLDPLADAADGTLHLERSVDEARREFGGIDYLHLFDWGYVPPYGRIYGRTGDYSPYDSLRGGQEALRDAIKAIQAQGVPVGLYIEGYLLEERGKLGQAFGRKWQLIGHDGKGLYWPDATEMFVCPAVDAWREVQASTYAAKVKELDVDGMYIDQFGFANSFKDCWSADHGHGRPSYAVETERGCTEIVRDRIERVKQNVAVYTEETPVDVTTQDQDGSFTYAMLSSRSAQTQVPVNMARFAVPSFKTIEILYCDKPTGSWATGVRWVFFNGEAIWLEGKADEWFEPETRRTIRHCYRILRKHRDAFTSLEAVPLVPTEMGGVFANRFPAGPKTVYTLYNARHRTVRGDVLRLPHRDAAAYYDEWQDRPIVARRDGSDDVIPLEIGPHGAGCVVVQM